MADTNEQPDLAFYEADSTSDVDESGFVSAHEDEDEASAVPPPVQLQHSQQAASSAALPVVPEEALKSLDAVNTGHDTHPSEGVTEHVEIGGAGDDASFDAVGAERPEPSPSAQEDEGDAEEDPAEEDPAVVQVSNARITAAA